MIRPPLMVPTDIGCILAITWSDSYMDDEASPRADFPVRTLGFLVDTDNKWISIAAEELPNDEGWRAVTHILRTNIQNIERLA